MAVEQIKSSGRVSFKHYLAIGNGVFDKLSDLSANFQGSCDMSQLSLCDVDTVVGMNFHIYIIPGLVSVFV